jgi:hypothetical protein
MQETNHRLSYDRHSFVTSLAATGDDQDVTNLRDLLLTKPCVGAALRFIGCWK